jgi:hypothetical protein
MQSTEDQVPTPDQPEEGTATFEKKPVAPVSSANRIHYLDELRGFALLGILIMNIQNFSMILASSMNPVCTGTVRRPEPANLLVYSFIRRHEDDVFVLHVVRRRYVTIH